MTAKELNTISKQPTYKEFLQLCKKADQLINNILKGPSRLQGRRPKTIKAAAIWHLAKQKDIDITMNHLYIIYGVYQPRLIEVHKIIEKEAKRQPQNP